MIAIFHFVFLYSLRIGFLLTRLVLLLLMLWMHVMYTNNYQNNFLELLFVQEL